MRLDDKNKIIRFSLIGIGAFLLLFLIVFNGAYWGVNGVKSDLDTSYVIMSVLIPFLVGIICFCLSGFFKSFTKQDAINQVEKQYRNGIISTNHYKSCLKEIELFELEKNKLKAQVEMEKEKFKAQLMKEAKKIKKEIIDEAKEE